MRAHLAVLIALLLALPCVPAPNIPFDPNTSYLSALSIPISSPATPEVEIEFSLTQGNVQYLYFDLPLHAAISSVDVRVKTSGASEIHVVVQQGSFTSHCDKPLLPSTSPYSCVSSKITTNEGNVTLIYPPVDRYFVTVILDSTIDASKSASFKVRTTVSSCAPDKAGAGCAFTVKQLQQSTDVSGFVPKETYQYYLWKQPVGGSFVLSLQQAVCDNPSDVILLFRQGNFPSLEASPMWPYYDLNLTCGDAQSRLGLVDPPGGDYWLAVYGGSKGANFTFGFESSPCDPLFAGGYCDSDEWWPIGSNAGPWCIEGGTGSCTYPQVALPWDHAVGSLDFTPLFDGWNYFSLPYLDSPAYTIKVAVTPASRLIPITLVLMRNANPTVWPQYSAFPQSAWVYYNVSQGEDGPAVTSLTVPYAAAGQWVLGVLANPAHIGNDTQFSVSASHYACFHNCTASGNGAALGTCNLATTQCKCNSGRTGADCSGKSPSKSHAGVIVGVLFGVFGGLALIGAAGWYFFMRPKTSYEMI